MIIPARLLHRKAAREGADDAAKDAGEEPQPGAGGRETLDGLEVQRHVEEHRQARCHPEKVGAVAREEGAVRDDAFGRDGLRGEPEFDRHKDEEREERGEEEREGGAVGPGDGPAAVEAEEEEEDGEDEGERAFEVDSFDGGFEVDVAALGQDEGKRDGHDGDQAGGDLKEKRPDTTVCYQQRVIFSAERGEYHLQPMLSANTPPNGAPVTEPTA